MFTYNLADCEFASQASCYATDPKCSTVQANTLNGCLMEDYRPRCKGVCTEHQRYAVAEKIYRNLECFASSDDACTDQVNVSSFYANVLMV